jgi:hypothetical protein
MTELALSIPFIAPGSAVIIRAAALASTSTGDGAYVGVDIVPQP